MWRVLDVLIANGMRLEIAETTRAGDAETFARTAAAQGADLVVAAGGDGTIAEVANGLAGSGARLGIIPLGTANVLAHELSLPFAPRAAAAALAFGRTRALWPGHAASAEGTRLFVQMLGVGFDAQVVHRLAPPLKRILGRGAYVVQTLREAARYRGTPIRVAIDGQETCAGSVIVSKGCLYAGRYRVAQNAHPDQPGFSVVLFDRSDPGAVLMYGAALPLHLLGRAPGVRQVRATRVEFLDGPRVAAQADGDAAGWAPLIVTNAPGPIQVVV